MKTGDPRTGDNHTPSRRWVDREAVVSAENTQPTALPRCRNESARLWCGETCMSPNPWRPNQEWNNGAPSVTARVGIFMKRLTDCTNPYDSKLIISAGGGRERERDRRVNDIVIRPHDS